MLSFLLPYQPIIYAVSTILFFGYFTVCSWQDWKSHTLPSGFAFAVYITEIINLSMTAAPKQLVWTLGEAVVLGLALMLAAYLFDIGGGDVIILPLMVFRCGLLTSIKLVVAGCLLTSILCLLHMLIRYRKLSLQAELPLIPGVTLFLFLHFLSTHI